MRSDPAVYGMRLHKMCRHTGSDMAAGKAAGTAGRCSIVSRNSGYKATADTDTADYYTVHLTSQA